MRVDFGLFKFRAVLSWGEDPGRDRRRREVATAGILVGEEEVAK